MVNSERDVVTAIAQQWADVRPDVDVSPMQVIGRVSRLSRLIDRRLGETFARFGLEAWAFDVLATLRRSGEPYMLRAGELMRQTMVTTGAMTNRIDRLEERGLVQRERGVDRRAVLVRLTRTGLETVDQVAPVHYETEDELLRPLSLAEREALADMLRTVLLHLGDRPAAGEDPG